MAKSGMQEYTHGVRLNAKFHPNWYILLPLRGEKSQVLPYFQL